jgi:hypothetical protein
MPEESAMERRRRSAGRFYSSPPAGRFDGRCSFCGAGPDLVQATVRGPGGVAICDGCVELSSEIIKEERKSSKGRV